VKDFSRKDRLYYRWEDDVFEREAVVSFWFQSTFKEVNEDGVKSFVQGPCSQAGGGQETQYKFIYILPWKNYERLAGSLGKIMAKTKWQNQN